VRLGKMGVLTATKTSQSRKHNSISGRGIYFSLLQNYQTGSGCYSVSSSIGKRESSLPIGDKMVAS